MRNKRNSFLGLAPSPLALALIAVAIIATCWPVVESVAQTRNDLPPFLLDPIYRSSRANEKKALHDGNEININFFNTGLQAGVGEVRGEWPKGSESFYVGDVVPTIVAEVPIDSDSDGIADTLIFHITTPRHPRSGTNTDPENSSIVWGFEPMGGFAREDGVNEKPAVSNDEDSWPNRWPDQPAWIDPATGQAQWNGFFGRNIQNADLESYYWIDDHNDLEVQRENPGFVSDTLDPTRGGLGLAVKVRGLQWSQFLAQDAMYTLYEVVNTSTTTYPRVGVGLTVGTLAGGDGDSQDDLAFFDQLNRIVYSWDFPPFIGANGQNVGIAGYAFMESPGNALDGIDNDGDSDRTDVDGFDFVPLSLRGEGNLFTFDDFQPRTLAAGDPLILIDGETFERSVVYLPDNGSAITVESQGVSFTVQAGTVLEETRVEIRSQLGTQLVVEKNLRDDDLDGIIDEDEFLHFERRAQEFSGDIKTLPPVRYFNYVGLANDTRGREPTADDSLRHGFRNLMIDESDIDGIDNDNDWNPLRDDVGADGAIGTGDDGEGDGIPTRGEPNFEGVDVNETDQVGLSSFFYFTPPGAVRMNDDDRVWEAMTPGFFTTNEELMEQQDQGGVDGDFIFGSGYFRLEPGQTLRFSMAMVFGNGQDFGQKLSNITRNVETVQEIFDRNYSFARPPEKPQLFAVPGDGQVTLYWDSAAEFSIDPILGEDFQGYKLYKSTDPNFLDAQPITDAFGQPALRAPIAQFDLDDGIEGFWSSTDISLINRVAGVPFYLGDNSGIKHSFVDTEVDNGQTYYYALTAYDSGNNDFFPAENSTLVSVTETGRALPDRNVAIAVPNAGAAGLAQGTLDGELIHDSGPATGQVFAEALNPTLFDDGASYTLSFNGDEFGSNAFSVTKSGVDVVEDEPFSAAEGVVFDGVRLSFRNDKTGIDREGSDWSDTTSTNQPLNVIIPNITVWNFRGTAVPYDYEIRISDQPTGQAFEVKLGTGLAPTAPEAETYFNVFNVSKNRVADFAFLENPSMRNARLDAPNETIYIYEDLGNGLVPTYGILYNTAMTGDVASSGDVFNVRTLKPFSSLDSYTFSTIGPDIEEDLAKAQLELIRVVPNPYVAAATWEKRNPTTITTGRGERRIDFTHIPAGATIKIYSVRGELIQELVHDGNIQDGSVSWDLRTRTGLDVSYGIYFYHVDADGIGEKTGKFAIIK
ncbi:MAG: hypothetical protein HKN43_15970 [Rhodothermales bacterium]|nr:hypothetical protein [Rhodothermales bacterium]